MRIWVSDVLDLFAAGLSAEQILEEMPELEIDDLKAALLYAFRKLNHPVLVAELGRCTSVTCHCYLDRPYIWYDVIT
jgi:Protein of unknown function (DUF433)